MRENNIILKALVGSRAHGLHSETSDYDYRGVHVIPTSTILSLGYKPSPTQWIEGDIDDTSYEIGHFLMLCTKANPSVLEVLLADQTKVDTPYAQQMRDMLPLMYNPKDAFNAFCGYSVNQRTKLLQDHLGRRTKFCVAYVRTAYNLVQLFETGTFSLRVNDSKVRQILLDIKENQYSDGEVIDIAESYIALAKTMLPDIPNCQDLGAINEFLMKVRKGFW